MPAHARPRRSRWSQPRHWDQTPFLDEDAWAPGASNTPGVEDASGAADHTSDPATRRDALDRISSYLVPRPCGGRPAVPRGTGPGTLPAIQP
jgi:hypothetical protein